MRVRFPVSATTKATTLTCAAVCAAFLAACHPAAQPVAVPATPAASGAAAPAGLGRVNHLVVIFLENRSFDNLYGQFAGADGLDAAAHAAPQADANGTLYTTLPQANGSPFPTTLPNAPFDMSPYTPPTVPTRDLVHRFYQEQMQINGGKMDRFVAVSDAKGQVLGHYRTDDLPVAQEAKQYTLCDRFFHSAFGGSFFNHFFLVATAPPVFPNATRGVAVLDSTGRMVKDGFITPDGYVINTAFTINTPHPANAPRENLVPNQTMPNIGDRMTEGNVSWAWYSEGWDDALAGHPDSAFQFHHQPFAYFANYADGTQAKKDHLKDEKEFFAAAAAGTLPQVSFVKPMDMHNEHAGEVDIMSGERHVIELINAVRNGPNWKDAAIIIAYDENGGWWDHVAPPVIDRWGPGTRIPAIVISPFAKKGYIDHTQYETASILATIEKRWGVKPVGTRDAHATNMGNAFEGQ